MNQHEIIIYYKYTPIADPAAFVAWLRLQCEQIGIKGRMLVAKEGINGSVEGTPEQIAEYQNRLRAQTFCDLANVWFKSSPGTGHAFKKLKVKVRSEIVATGLPADTDVDPNIDTGTHIDAAKLHEWINSGEQFEIIDMRNEYEYNVGHFAGSHNSTMGNFRDLPVITPKFDHLKTKKVLTVCTYGVRCEKASGYLKQQGFQDVYQLHGGIGTYLKQYPGQDFHGSLYVFDDRMTEQFTPDYTKVGQCVACAATSERFGNCAWDECHKQLIICESCSVNKVWCSPGCRVQLRGYEKPSRLSNFRQLLARGFRLFARRAS